MKVSEPKRRPKIVNAQEYHGSVRQNSGSETDQDYSWSSVRIRRQAPSTVRWDKMLTFPAKRRRNPALLF
ncbi:hypothetical protein C2U53_15970 [Citrobacter sp. CFNIH10]|nr:hypothetical protein C2U53_15970 [Citrobacter sp. CFNIH10]AVC45318.1 hypothetical protein AL524_25430 [Citrobacter amalonaticus]PNP35162.1 hypothetical protein AL525_015525 [Citrobacter amalonaticus]